MEYETGKPAPSVQNLLDKVDIDENVAVCKPKSSSTTPASSYSSNFCNKTLVFPPGAKVLSALPHGASFWTRTAKITLVLEDNSQQSIFLKVAQGSEGLGLVQGEYEAGKALYDIAGDFIPRPIGAGTYKSSPDTHFCLTEFVDMIDELPDMQKFCAKLAKMHRDSIPHSASGKFGFHVVTYNGNKARDVTWCNTWEEWFSNAMRRRLEQEQETQGPSEDYDRLLPALFEKVIPRLLRPLHTGPNKIKPVLVHGDVWYGNLATNAATDEPIIFDPATIWAHNECE